VKRFRPDTLIVLASGGPAQKRGGDEPGDAGPSPIGSSSWCRITPDGAKVAIKPWTTDLRLLRKASDEAKCFMRDALRMARPARQV
jgi:hypothetical protein